MYIRLTDFSYWLPMQWKEQMKWISTSTRSPLCLQWPSGICWWMLTHASQFFTVSEGERGHTHAHWHLLCEPVASSHPEGTENNSPHTTPEERPSRACWQYISRETGPYFCCICTSVSLLTQKAGWKSWFISMDNSNLAFIRETSNSCTPSPSSLLAYFHLRKCFY